MARRRSKSRTYSPAAKVSSSAIADIDYNNDTHVLTVSFTKGGSHSYSGVPEQVVDSFLTASSQGTYFNANIRNRY